MTSDSTIHSNTLTWALCVATINRLGELQQCVSLACEQGRAPSEVIICDASDDWQENRAAIETITSRYPNIPLKYLEAERKSLTYQRNQSITEASADILFLIDDDSFMMPGFAEKMLQHYEEDTDHSVAAIASSTSSEDPRRTRSGNRKVTGMDEHGLLARVKSDNPIARWVWKHIFLMSGEGFFIFFDDGVPRRRSSSKIIDTYPRNLISGWSMTVRREVAAAELFDGHLLAYCPSEDADATYRFNRHGYILGSNIAGIFHMNTGANRIKRRIVAELQVSNVAYFIRRSSVAIAADRRKFNTLMLRRIFAEICKDGLSRRFDFPQVRGVVAGMRRARTIFDYEKTPAAPSLGDWYEIIQGEILNQVPHSVSSRKAAKA